MHILMRGGRDETHKRDAWYSNPYLVCDPFDFTIQGCRNIKSATAVGSFCVKRVPCTKEMQKKCCKEESWCTALDPSRSTALGSVSSDLIRAG